MRIMTKNDLTLGVERIWKGEPNNDIQHDMGMKNQMAPVSAITAVHFTSTDNMKKVQLMDRHEPHSQGEHQGIDNPSLFDIEYGDEFI